MLARWASTVLTLIFSRLPISLFLNPAQINSKISCSREVSDSGRRVRGGGSRFMRDFRGRGLALTLAMMMTSPLIGSGFRYTRVTRRLHYRDIMERLVKNVNSGSLALVGFLGRERTLSNYA